MSVFSPILEQTQLPAPALAPLEKALVEAYELITQNNERVAQINAAKAQDPNNTEYLDTLWRTKAPADEKMKEVEEQYQTLVAESEKLLSQLRDFARTQVKPPLSEEAAKNMRKLVNETAPAIQTAKAAASAMASVVDSVLEARDVKLEGGILSLLPPVESLKNARGRKGATGEKGPYMTRIGGLDLDGKSTNTDEGKAKFNYGADKLSEMWGANIHPENKVTAEELEEAYFGAMGKEFRSLRSTELPEKFEFVFEKTVKVQNANDNSFTEIPKKVKVTVYKPVAATTTPETKATEVPAQEEAKTENASKPAAKKAAAATQAKK